MKCRSTIQIVAITIAAISLVGCASRQANKSTISEPSGAQVQSAQPSESASAAEANSQVVSSNEVAIPLHQETLSVGKRTVGAGQVTIHKRVTTQTVQQPVDLRSETIDISHEAAGAAAPSTGQGAISQPFEEGSVTIQLNKEEPVVQKNTIVSGEVIARKNAQTKQTMIQDQVRKEEVQVVKSPDAVVQDKGQAAAEAENKDTGKQQQ